ncbi:RHS repeat-associated core domain-containing protein [Tahibacter caeni]|uniref:RHS repeat-associated core domain-containing protein n=1 Tax=Tahibacter caeni TaxID=1453545 RepID=UPI0021485F42|nr:RHS repeat-associated core domain-containing protein [Tahibacter caeni]
MIRIYVLVALWLGLTALAIPASASCDLPANASSVYGYLAPNGQRCRTLEEAEASMRADMPLMENAFGIPGQFDSGQPPLFTLDYRPYGALGTLADVLKGPPATTVSSYRAYVKNWPPLSPLAACSFAGCGAGGCPSPELERQRLECELDATWDNDPRYCWTRTAPLTLSGTVTRFRSVSGAGNASGSLLFAPASSTANDSGAQLSASLQSCPGTSEASGERTTAATQTVNWGMARQDAITCAAGSAVNAAASGAGNACAADFAKQVIDSPQLTQTPNQCKEGNPCYPGNGNKSADVAVFDYGRIHLDLHYSSLRQLRNYAYVDTNWSHSFARRVLTEWSQPNHLGANPEVNPIEAVAVIYVQDEQRSLEVYRRDASLPAGTFRATSNLGRLLRYVENGVVPPYYELTDTDGRRETYDRAGRLVAMHDPDDPSKDLSLTYRGRVIAAEPNIETAHFEEAFWRIDRITDASGRYVNFNYTDAQLQKLESLVADDGTELARLVYDRQGRLASLQRFGKSQGFLYNEPAYLGVTATVRGSWLTGIQDEDLRRYATYAYDDWGRAIASWHGIDAGRIDITYPLKPDGNQDDSRAIVRTPSLRETTYTFAANQPYRVPASISDQAGTVQFEYHPVHHRLTARIDRRGVRTEIEYNADATHETARTEAKGRPEQRRIERDWDYAIGRLTAERLYADPPGGPRTLLRDRRFSYAPGTALLLWTELVDPIDGRSRRTSYTYCSAADVANPSVGCALVGQLKRIDGPRTDVADLTDYAYYTSDALGGCGTPGGACRRKGDLRSITNALGQVTEILAYDRAGRPARVRDANNTLVDYTYHARGWLLTRSIRANADGTPSAGDATTTLEYDESGNLTRVLSPDNAASLTYTYDAAHRVIGVRDALGNRIAYTLTSNGDSRFDRRFTPVGVTAWQFTREFDELNRLVRELDGLGRPVQRLELDDATQGILNGYDANGNPRRSIDGRDVQTERQYDGLDRLVKTLQDFGGTDPTTANAQTQFGYDALDRLTGVVDPDGIGTGYVYDGLGDLRQENSNDAGNRSFTYDLAGNRTGETDARGKAITHVYDALNRRTDTFYPDLTRRIRRDYDLADSQTGCVNSYPKGRLSRIVDVSGTTVYCYDRRGNVVRKRILAPGQSSGGDVLDYAYDRADLLKSVTYPGGAVVTYQRDASARVSGVQWQPDAGGAITNLVSQATYYPFGPLNSMTFGNGRQLSKRYDKTYAIDQIESTLPAGLLFDFDNDVLGNVTQIATALGGTPQRRYGYDALNRLTQMRDAADLPLETFTYSRTGDRTSKRLGAQTAQPYSYVTGTHRIANSGNGARNYDGNGNTTGLPGISSYPLVYDDTNRLVQVSLDGQGSVQDYAYAHNGLGQRTRKDLPGERIDTVYDESGLRLVDSAWLLNCGSSESFGGGGSGGPGTTGAGGSAGGTGASASTGGAAANGGSVANTFCTQTAKSRTEYIYLDGLPIAIARYTGTSTTAQLSYIETDHLGTPRLASDAATQAVQWRWDLLQTSFGDHPATVLVSGFELNLRYPGQYFDAETGLHYNYFRNYDPKVGRYVESDPTGLRGGINLYAYASSRSLSSIDYFGLETWLIIRTEPSRPRDPVDAWLLPSEVAAARARAECSSCNIVNTEANRVRHLQYLLDNNTDIVRVIIIGHSGRSAVYFSPWLTVDSNLSVDKKTERDTPASSIRWNNLLPNATIELWGCQNGVDDGSIAAAIARASGRRVIGTTDVVNFDEDGIPFVRFHRDPFGNGFREFKP